MLRWWRLEKYPEWVEQKRDDTDPKYVRCTGVARQLRLIYVPMLWSPPVLVVYESPRDYWDYREYPGGRAILNAFRIVRTKP